MTNLDMNYQYLAGNASAAASSAISQIALDTQMSAHNFEHLLNLSTPVDYYEPFYAVQNSATNIIGPNELLNESGILGRDIPTSVLNSSFFNDAEVSKEMVNLMNAVHEVGANVQTISTVDAMNGYLMDLTV